MRVAGDVSLELAAATAIAATTDGEGTDYVFFQTQNGNIVRGLQTGQGVSDFLSLGPAAKSSRIAAAYGDYGAGEGAFVIYNSADTPGQAMYELRDRSGEVLASGSIG